MRALTVFFLVFSCAMSSAQVLEYQRQIQVSSTPISNPWYWAVMGGGFNLSPDQAAAAAECLESYYGTPHWGETYILRDECVLGASSIQAVGNLDNLAVQAARVSGRPISLEPMGQMTYFAATPSGGYQSVRVGNVTYHLGGTDHYASWEADHQVTVPHGAGIRAIARDYCGCIEAWLPYCEAEIKFRTGRTGLIAGEELYVPSMYPYIAPTGAVYVKVLRDMTFYSLSNWIEGEYGGFALQSFRYSVATYVSGREEAEWTDIPTGTVLKFYPRAADMEVADNRNYRVLVNGWRAPQSWLH